MGFPLLGLGPLPSDSLPFLLGLRGRRQGFPDWHRLLQEDVEVGCLTGDPFSCSRPVATPAEENPSLPLGRIVWIRLYKGSSLVKGSLPFLLLRGVCQEVSPRHHRLLPEDWE